MSRMNGWVWPITGCVDTSDSTADLSNQIFLWSAFFSLTGDHFALSLEFSKIEGLSRNTGFTVVQR
jgi:hypothetical protein